MLPCAVGINPSSAFIMVVLPAPLVSDDCGYRALRNAERAVLPDDVTASFDAGVVEFDAGRCLVVHGFSLI